MENLSFNFQIDEFMLFCRTRKLRVKTMNSYEQALRLFERWCWEQFEIDILVRPPLAELWVLSGDFLACLRALHNHAALILRKRKQDCQDQIACQRILYHTHVQNVNPDPSVE